MPIDVPAKIPPPATDPLPPPPVPEPDPEDGEPTPALVDPELEP